MSAKREVLGVFGRLLFLWIRGLGDGRARVRGGGGGRYLGAWGAFHSVGQDKPVVEKRHQVPSLQARPPKANLRQGSNLTHPMVAYWYFSQPSGGGHPASDSMSSFPIDSSWFML